MENFEIRGRHFRTKSDYAAGFRDNRIIEGIERKVNKLSLTEVTQLREDLENKKYNFETLLGEDYLDEIIELEEELKKKRAAAPDSSKKKGLRRKGKVTSTTEAAVVSKELEDYDAEMQQQIVKELKKRELRRKLFLAVLGVCIAGSIGYLVFYFTLYEKNDMEYTELEEMIVKDSGVKINYSDDPEAPPILEKYAALYQKNKKLVGWIKVDGCDIDYPVMQTSNNDYYLDHNYNQEYDKNGSIFMDKNCTPAFPNDNMILYGHHMKSGKMFGNLNRYASEDFFKKNPTFTFDTIYEEGTYAVMYVFRSQIYTEEDIVFKYYQFIDAASPDEFYSNMEEMEALQLYDTGVLADYGDKLITLSTCDDAVSGEGRFVVVGKKIK